MNKYGKIGLLMNRSLASKAKADKDWEAVKKALGAKNVLSYSRWEHDDGRPAYSFDVPLAEFLTLFPDAPPRKTTWDHDGTRSERFAYGPCLAAAEPHALVYVGAYTEPVRSPIPASENGTPAPETASA